jgi:hypothetical protein
MTQTLYAHMNTRKKKYDIYSSRNRNVENEKRVLEKNQIELLKINVSRQV